METYIDSRIIYLSSRTATRKNNGSYNSDVEFEMQGLITNQENIENVYIQLINAQIPVSFYNINETCNKFKLSLSGNPAITYTIENGNYSATTLINKIESTVNDNNFNITFNKINGIMTFNHNQPFTIYNNNVANSIAFLIGFENYDYTNIASPHSIAAIYPLNLLGIKNINLYSFNLSTNNCSSDNNGFSTILHTVPVDAPPYGLIKYHNVTITKNLLNSYNIDLIDLRLFDERKNLINFNNADWTITFQLDIIRKRFKNNLTIYDLLNQKNITEKKDKNTIENLEVPVNDLDILTA